MLGKTIDNKTVIKSVRRGASPLEDQLGKSHSSLPSSMGSYLENNNIGGLGCKYLSRAFFSSIQRLWLGKSVVIKRVIMLEARGYSTSPKRSGIR
jgi:hypothetical protein